MALRKKLGLPVDRKIVLSVGWISAQHQRMDYLIDEIAPMGAPRPFLVMVGRKDDSTPAILSCARDKLGEANFTAVSVPYKQVSEYFLTANVFALASLREGLGRVYLEAMVHGLRCAVHDHPVMRYVLGDHGVYGDFLQPGVLARLVTDLLNRPDDEAARQRRKENVRKRFSWPSLGRQYVEMFQQCLAPRPLSP